MQMLLQSPGMAHSSFVDQLPDLCGWHSPSIMFLQLLTSSLKLKCWKSVEVFYPVPCYVWGLISIASGKSCWLSWGEGLKTFRLCLSGSHIGKWMENQVKLWCSNLSLCKLKWRCVSSEVLCVRVNLNPFLGFPVIAGVLAAVQGHGASFPRSHGWCTTGSGLGMWSMAGSNALARGQDVGSQEYTWNLQSKSH